MSNSAQNDWEKRFDGLFSSRGLDHVECFDEISHRDSLKSFIRKELADARKEVIDKIKQWAIKNLGGANFEEIDGLNELLDVLATLREE